MLVPSIGWFPLGSEMMAWLSAVRSAALDVARIINATRRSFRPVLAAGMISFEPVTSVGNDLPLGSAIVDGRRLSMTRMHPPGGRWAYISLPGYQSLLLLPQCR